MKLAYYISEYPSRSHTFIRREIAELRKRGLRIVVFSTRKCNENELISDQDRDAYQETWSVIPPKLVPFILAHAWAISTKPKFYFKTIIKSLKHRLPGVKNTIWALFYFAEAMYLAFEINRQNIRHIHVHFANSGAYVVKNAAYFLDLTWSMNLHGACDFEYPDGPLLGEKIESATFVNCASYYGRSQAMRTVSTENWEKIFVSRCGIEVAQMEDPGKIRDKAQDALVRVLSVGRLSSEKGQFGLLEAFSDALKRKSNMILILVGDGPDRRLLEEYTVFLDIKEKVEFVGNISETEVFDQMKNADICAIASYMEGIPIVLMEAMALHLPVIAPHIAGIPELVHDKVNGLLFTPGNWPQLADSIIELACDSVQRSAYATKARQHVCENFAIEKAVMLLFKRIQQLDN